MLRYKDGDADAFDTLYSRHRGSLYRYFARQVPRAAVNDLFQEVWLRVIRAQDRYRGSAPFPAYLYRIAHNVLVDHYRRNNRGVEFSSPEPPDLEDPGAGPERALQQGEIRARIVRALEKLPAAQREVFLLHQEAGLTLEEIARVVGVGRETIKSRLRYAINKLRQDLAGNAPVSEKQA